METVCRLCAEKDEGLVQISTSITYSVQKKKPVELGELIEQYISIDRSSLSSEAAVCPKCLKAIVEWHLFRERCLVNEEQFRNQRVILFAADPSISDESYSNEGHELIVQEKDASEGFTVLEDDFADEQHNVTETRGCWKLSDNTAANESNGEGRKLQSLDKDPQPGRESNLNGMEHRSDRSTIKCAPPTVAKQEDKAKMCHICGKVRYDLTIHMRCHSKERPYACPHCPKIFTSSSNLSNHINRHTRERMYGCEFCGKQFTSSSCRNRHQEGHASDRPYVCPVCGRSFKYHNLLTRHKRIHFEQPQVKCPDCEKVFLTNERLKKHGLVHLDAKPFSCGICNTSFNRKDNLRKHLKKHVK